MKYTYAYKTFDVVRHEDSMNADSRDEVFAELRKRGIKAIKVVAADQREIRELKQIVNGMRDEMRAYLANGNGTARSFWRRLNECTLSEMQIYERTKRELEKEQSSEIWEQKNESLRTLGLRTIPLPEER